MTITFYGILMGLGLLAIWSWLAISITKIKFQVVTSSRIGAIFDVETRLIRIVMKLCLFFSVAILAGSYIRIIRGV